MRIAVDLGYGFVKAVAENGKKVIFPSVVAPYNGTGVLAGLGQQDEHKILFWPNGEPNDHKNYLVGDAAMVAGGVRTWEEKAAQDPNLKIKLITALALLTDQNGVNLAVGLPLAMYKEQKEEIKETLEGIDVHVVIGEKTARVKVEEVFVFPQAAGVYYAGCLTPEGELKKDLNLLNQPVGVIDIGYRTTDFLVMARSKKGLAPREDLSGSIDVGMNLVYQNVQKTVEVEVGKMVNIMKIELALSWNSGQLVFGGQSINLKPKEEKALGQISERICAELKKRWGGEIDFLATILVAGGGGKALYPHLKEALPAVRKVENAVHANAEGFLAAQALNLKGKAS